MDKGKILKLTNELYSLTLFFPRKEPLRYKMREIADEILAFLIEIENNKTIPKDFFTKIEILDSFFEIARAQNWVKSGEILNLQKEYQKIKEECLNLSLNKEPSRKNYSSQTMNTRQQKILEILREREKIQVWELKEIFPEISKRTLRRDFAALVRKGLIERVGSQSNTFYKLKTEAKSSS